MPITGGGNPLGSGGAGVGKGLNYLENHAYATSGSIDAPNVETTLLEFQLGGHYIDSRIQVTNGSGSNDDINYKVYLNGQIVGQWYFTSAVNIPEPAMPFLLIIPPYAKVKVTAINVSSSSGRAQTAVVTGRVYR